MKININENININLYINIITNIKNKNRYEYDISIRYKIYINIYVNILYICRLDGSLEDFRSQTSDNMQRWKSRGGNWEESARRSQEVRR